MEALQHRVVLGLSFPEEDQGTLARLAPLGIRMKLARCGESGARILQGGQMDRTDMRAALSLELHG